MKKPISVAAVLGLTMSLLSIGPQMSLATSPTIGFTSAAPQPTISISGNQASRVRDYNISASGFTRSISGWFACSTMTNAANQIFAEPFSGVTSVTVEAGGVKSFVINDMGAVTCNLLDSIASDLSVDLSAADIFLSGAWTPYSAKVANFPQVTFAEVWYESTNPSFTLAGSRVVVSQTRLYIPPAPAPSASVSPTVDIQGATIVAGDTIYSGSPQPSFQRHYFVCRTAVTSPMAATKPYVNGNADWWLAGTTNAQGAGITIGTGTGCLAYEPGYGSSTRLASGGNVGAGMTTAPYNPASHGTHIVFGTRVLYLNIYYWELSASDEYIQQASPTAVMPVFTFVSDAITFTTQPSWTGEDANSEAYFVFACHASITAASTPTTPTSAAPNGCVGLYTSGSTLGSLTPATSLPTAQVVVSGSLVAYDPSAHGRNIAIQSAAKYSTTPYRVTAASQYWMGNVGGGSPSQVATTPYTGPVVQAPGAVKPVAGGSKLVLDGSNLTGVSKVTIDGKDASGKVNPDGKLEITVPKGLAEGTYDLVITSDSGLLTVQDAIKVSGSAVSGEEPTPSTRLKEDDTVKVYVFNVVGAGKVQIMHNGEEVAWINTDDPDDVKILNDYLVRTLELLNGKNIIEIYVNGVRIDRKAYTKTSDEDSSSRI